MIYGMWNKGAGNFGVANLPRKTPNLTVNPTRAHGLIFGKRLVGAPVTSNVRCSQHAPCHT